MTKDLAINKKANFDYQIIDKLECGIVLTGSEVKTAKAGLVNLTGSYAIIRKKGAFLINTNFPPYQAKNINFAYDAKRTKKLLLRKKEILQLMEKIKKQNLTLIPLRMYNKKGLIKVEVALAKGKKKIDKEKSSSKEKRKEGRKKPEKENIDWG